MNLENATTRSPRDLRGRGTSGIIYDALSLEHDARVHESASAVTALLQPSIYYMRKGGGSSNWPMFMCGSASGSPKHE